MTVNVLTTPWPRPDHVLTTSWPRPDHGLTTSWPRPDHVLTTSLSQISSSRYQKWCNAQNLYLHIHLFLGIPNDEIELELVYPDVSTKYFYLDGKSLRLSQPIDRDPQDLAQISLQVSKPQFRKYLPNYLWIVDWMRNYKKLRGNFILVDFVLGWFCYG